MDHQSEFRSKIEFYFIHFFVIFLKFYYFLNIFKISFKINFQPLSVLKQEAINGKKRRVSSTAGDSTAKKRKVS